MANTYFKFKHFIIHQDKAAMKVGTDGVLLGAWANVACCNKILDVGTGTGLIALMLAQRNQDASLVAIDIDDDAVLQAHDNFKLSAWNSRLQVDCISLQLFAERNLGLFDHVVCNPPFFTKSYKSTSQSRNLARHTETLSYQELIHNAYRVTNSEGRLSVVLPWDVEDDFICLAADAGFYPVRIIRIKPTPTKEYVRILVELSKVNTRSIEFSDMIIEDKGRHGYSDDYIELTRSFYLNM